MFNLMNRLSIPVPTQAPGVMPNATPRFKIDPRIFQAMSTIGTAMATKNPAVFAQAIQNDNKLKTDKMAGLRTANWLRRNGASPELVQMAQNGQANQAFQLYAMEKKKSTAPAGVQEYEYFKKNNPDYKGNYLQFLADKKGKGTEGASITLPDGTVVRTNTKYDQKQVAEQISDQQKVASNSSSLKDTIKFMRNHIDRAGYTGPGESFINFADDMLEGFGVKGGIGLGGYNPFGDGGDSASRAVLRSGTMDFVLDKISKTKGAISDSEMRIFAAASAGMSQSKEGMKLLLDIADKIADREVERADAMEKWRQTHGNSLDGFEKEWAAYIEANPIVTEQALRGVQAPPTDNSLNDIETEMKKRGLLK